MLETRFATDRYRYCTAPYVRVMANAVQFCCFLLFMYVLYRYCTYSVRTLPMGFPVFPFPRVVTGYRSTITGIRTAVALSQRLDVRTGCTTQISVAPEHIYVQYVCTVGFRYIVFWISITYFHPLRFSVCDREI